MSDNDNKRPFRWHALFTEEDTTRSEDGKPPAYKMSIGRMMGWIMFGIMVYMWLTVATVPQSLMTAFLSIVAYNLGKKSSLFQDALSQKTGVKETKES